ncbi:MAG: SRPBCC family protein [Chloroflexota bacterium]
MPRFQKSIDMNVPPEKAYAYLSDIRNHADWSSHGLKVEMTSPEPVAVGSTFSSTGNQMGEHKGIVTIAELIPNKKIVYESSDDTGKMRHAFELAAQNGGTRVTKSFETVKTGLLLTVFRPMMYIVQPSMLNKDLTAIKAKLES